MLLFDGISQYYQVCRIFLPMKGNAYYQQGFIINHFFLFNNEKLKLNPK